MLSELHWENILLHILNMAILFVIVRFLVYRPLRRFLSARSERVAASLEEARKAREEADALHAQARGIIAGAEEEARARAMEITSAANESVKAMTETAQAQGRAITEKAKAAAQAEHDKAMAGLRTEVIDLATGMAAQILRQEMNAQDTLRVAQEYFKSERDGDGGDAA